MSARNLYSSLLAGTSIALCLVVFTASAGAFQDNQFKEDREIPEPDKKVFQQYRSMIRNGTISPDIFDKALNYTLNSFTFPENRGNLPKMRQVLVRELQSSGLAGDESAHKRMRERVLQATTRLIGKDYHPFVRVNAMLLLGELNIVEPPRLFNEPPVAHPEALKVMLQAIEDEEQIDAVRAAALIGIGRHAKLGVKDEALHRQVRQAAVKLTGAKQHLWLRRQAVDILGDLGEMGNNGEIALLLMKLIADGEENLSVRCHAARSFGSLDFNKGPRIKYKLAGQMLVQLTIDAIAKANPNGGTWTESQIETLQSNLALIEVGFKGLPDPDHRFAPNNPHPAPVTGMLLALGQGDSARKSIDEAVAKYDELLNMVFSDAFQPKDVEYMQTQFKNWLTDNPVEDRTLMAGQDPLPG